MITPLKRDILQLIVDIDTNQKALAKQGLNELVSREAKCLAGGELIAYEQVMIQLIKIVERDDELESKESSADEQTGEQSKQQVDRGTVPSVLGRLPCKSGEGKR